jgi:hypothetical protein
MTEMFLGLVGERPRPARIPKNLLAGGTGIVHTDTKLTQRLEIPMAVSDACKLAWVRFKIPWIDGDPKKGLRIQDI